MGKRLYVGNIPYETTEAQLRTLFEQDGAEAARSEPIGLILQLAPVAEKSFRAVLVTALISSLPRSPERIYAGKRVRITGIVQRFQAARRWCSRAAARSRSWTSPGLR